MDRQMLKRGLVAVGGLGLILAASGCRDRNLRVPPPTHYSDGESASPDASPYPGYSSMTEPSSTAPYPSGEYGYNPTGTTGAAATPGPAGGYDPAALPAGGFSNPESTDGATPQAMNPYAGAGSTAPAAAYPGHETQPSAGYSATIPGTPALPGGSEVSNSTDVFASPSSASPAPAAADPYDGMIPGTPEAAPATLDGFDGVLEAPPIPDDLPDMP